MKAPEYDGIFQGREASEKKILSESPELIHTIDVLVRMNRIVGQRELPPPFASGDVVYRYVAPPVSSRNDYIDYTIFQQ